MPRFALLVIVFALAPSLLAQAAVSAQGSIEYLKRAMDEFHNRFPVYDDVSSAGNHFHAYAKLPNENATVDINGSWTTGPHSGATAIRCQYTAQAGGFGGFYFQNGTLSGVQTAPQPNFGDVPNAGINLTGATAVTFWAKGDAGGERIDFFVAGVGRVAETGVPTNPYPDSSPRRPAQGSYFTLTPAWQKYTIDLTGADLSYVLGGFGWVASAALNPSGAVFYLDDIQYELGAARLAQRLDEPRLVRSFTTLPLQPDPFDGVKDGDIDFVLRNLAFTYDNALAILAFLADGSADSIRRARLIGDAFVYATQHDRTFDDDRTCGQAIDPLSTHGARLRSAYAAGDLALPPGWTPKGRIGTVPIPGFYAESTKTFYEVEQQAVDTGNNAWAVIALLALHGRTGDASYLTAACKTGNFISSFRKESGTYRGFTGGVMAPDDASPSLRPWASAEHNIDINAAFSTLFQATGDTRWQQDAEHARQFVEAMWDPSRNCFLAGTTDPETRNAAAGKLPLDVQAWSILSLGGVLTAHPQLIDCAQTNHLNTHDGFTGFDFNDDKDGVWFEGTGQMAVAYALSGHPTQAETYRATLRQAQATPPDGDTQALTATAHDGLTTGFDTAGGDPFKYFRRFHTGASAWNVFAQLALNPFYSRTLTVSVTGGGTVSSTPPAVLCPGSCAAVAFDGKSFTLAAAAATGWTFAGWGGACSGTSTQCALTLTANLTASAAFVSLPLPPPAALEAHYGGAAAVLTWSAVPGAASYEVGRSADGQAYATIGMPVSNGTSDGTVMAGHAYLYRVRSRSADGTPSAWTSPELMTAVVFSDDPLLAGNTPVLAAHLTQLRAAVNAVRTLASLSAAAFTDPAPAGATIRALHVTELRNALAPARTALALPAVQYAHASLQPAVSVVTAVDIAEIRGGVR